MRVFRAPPREEEEHEEEGEKKEEGTTTAERLLELAAEARPLPPCEVNCVKWRPGKRKKDPPMLAAACDDGVVRLWRLEEKGASVSELERV